MAPVVKLQDVVGEMELLSDRVAAYLNKKTGNLITVIREELEAAKNLPDLNSYSGWERDAMQQLQDILHTDDYLPLPTSYEIDRYSIVKEFCCQIEDDRLSGELLSQIRGSEAFRRFKQTIDRLNLVEDWYRYRQQAFEKIAIDWLEENGIEYDRGNA